MAARAACLSSSTPLFDAPPAVMERLCKLIDCGDGDVGWRGLAERILPDWLEVRCMERVGALGKSPTRELLWSWAQKNKTVGDLLEVLQDMGHQRAMQLFMPQGFKSAPSPENVFLSKLKEHTSERESNLKTVNNADVLEVSEHHHCYSVHRPNEGLKQTPVLQYSDIVNGTRNFHPDFKIGEGSFSEGRQAEWKKLWKLFMSDIEVLLLYRHPNILELCGYNSEDGVYCVVYPYMSNGSLFSRLHCQDALLLLPWQLRLSIARGTATAVNHLHTAQPCCVICGNITSTNILLDEHFEPKLCDFGMACLRPHSVNQSYTISLDAGSRSHLGYLPEEYIRDGKLSVKLDVYSLGVVIMEILTGRPPVQDGPKHTKLKDFLHQQVEEGAGVDSCLQFLDTRAGPWPSTVSFRLFRLALDCTASRPKNRPAMSTVLEMLNELKAIPCDTEDQPHTLKDKVGPDRGLGPSLPVENDEMQGFFCDPEPDRADLRELRAAQAKGGPCECSQSEVTFTGGRARLEESLSSAAGGVSPGDRAAGDTEPCNGLRESVDLYCSWPVECSCTAEENGQECDECRANGFISAQPHPQKDDAAGCSRNPDILDNAAKEKIRNRIELYNKGLLNTGELLSMKELN
ncbi:interleukin-1 receptor-associated kinase 3 isoform X2 [Amia ocellicauda]|uniref:interleukin-1 receptor-associated kinase 3 isoform X2 n=1 Tax=Amia ocellicauda TaxID=2972642 RepID=UPI003464AA30